VSVLAGLFLIAHGLVHLAVWVAPAPPDAPFDSRRSWLLGAIGPLATVLAILACVLLAVAGVLVLAGAGADLAIAGAAVSLVLVLLTFHRWLSFGVVIDVAIIAIALA
jgi:uncharacterized membrane protein YphA (DoxX/SURF4 family)